MSVQLMIYLGILVFLIFAYIIMYNNLVALKNQMLKYWSDIGISLKQRHDELPKLIETCKAYMKHEQTTLTQVMEARSQATSALASKNVAAVGQAEATLQTGLRGLFATVESYPDLKANQDFINLQNRITNLEGAIADRREQYNESVNVYNVEINSFPNLIVAAMSHFSRGELLKFTEEETKDPNVKELFNT